MALGYRPLADEPLGSFGTSGGAGTTTGTLAATDGADAAAFTAGQTSLATLAAIDGADAAAFTAFHAVPIAGTLAATDGADAATLIAGQTSVATLAATDGADAAAITAIHGNFTAAQLVATDGADAAALTAGQTSKATLAATDGADICAFAANSVLAITATFAATDGADSASLNASAAEDITATLDATDGADEALFSSGDLGGKPVFTRRRKRYLIKDRVYNDLDPADVIAAAREAGVDLGDVREVTKEPTARKKAPRHADDDGREYWLPQEFWGRAAARERTQATTPLADDFQRVVAALGASQGPAQARLKLRRRQEEEAILLLTA